MEELLKQVRGGGKGAPPSLPRGGSRSGSGLDSQQAQHIWSFLDDLANKDPEEYKKFMEEKMREAKQLAKTTREQREKPCFVISSTTTGTSNRLYINFLSSSRCPALQKKNGKPAGFRIIKFEKKTIFRFWMQNKEVETTCNVTKLLSGLVLMIRLKTPISEVVIPLHVGKLNQMKDYSYVDVILHPGVIERSGKEMAFKLYLCEVAVTHVEEDHKLTISRGYQLENELKYKGEKLRNMAAAAAAASKKAPPFGMPPMPKPGATTTASNSGSEASSSSSSNQHAQGKGRNDKQTTGKRRPLIEDITMVGWEVSLEKELYRA
eukprot:jgi/Bigna1/86798/estExt_fgenesh1_pg.C_140022